MLKHMDPKKFPKRPDRLWDEHAGDQTVETMIAMAKMMAGNSNEKS